MDQRELQDVLKKLRFSADLSEATVAKLAGLITERDAPPGTVIFEENADHPWIYLIVEGQVALEMCVPARGCTRILTLGPGDLLAWSSVLGGSHMTAGAQSLTEVRLLAAPARGLLDLCAADHDFGYDFYRGVAAALSKRLVATRLQLLDLYRDPTATAAPVAWG